MFNLKKQTERIKLLKVARIKGLPYKRRPQNPKVQHIESEPQEIEAIREGVALSKCKIYRIYSPDFGCRLRKSSGQDHKRRGHYQCGRYRFGGLKKNQL